MKQPVSPTVIDYRARSETVLKALLPSGANSKLNEAMRYATLGGGKRLRPTLVYLTGTLFNASLASLDAPAAAIELIHAYSLVHDDLPAMDDDNLRRGKPTCHKAFDEATGILTGDALQALAFNILSRNNEALDPSRRLKLIQTLTNASQDMVAGQALDLASEKRHPTLQLLERIHRLKTGALIRASVIMGAQAAGCHNSRTLEILTCFADNLGLAFQIQDDILDCEGNSATLGKHTGKDEALEKATYPKLIGLAGSKEKVTQLINAGRRALLKISDDTKALEALLEKIQMRSS